MLGDVAVAVVRIDDDVYAIGDVCSHADVSLSGGEVYRDEREIECPQHGSVFSLTTGEPCTLPATQPVPVFDVVVADGMVTISRRVEETAMSTLEIRDLRVAAGGKEILRGIDLTVSSGEVHAVMGPNGAGKSTLSGAIMGKPGHEVLGGSVTLDGVDVLALPVWERAAAGIHLVMQYPTEVPGVALDDVMSEALAARERPVDDVDTVLAAEARRIGLPERLLHRSLNVDLSGGEKKRNETLQLAVLAPRIAMLDELDSGLDIDALRACSRRIEALTQPADGGPGLGVLVITHYSRILTELHPDRVHILVKGRIVAEGGPELADRLEVEGYAAFAGAEADAEPAAAPDPLGDLFGARN